MTQVVPRSSRVDLVRDGMPISSRVDLGLEMACSDLPTLTGVRDGMLTSSRVDLGLGMTPSHTSYYKIDQTFFFDIKAPLKLESTDTPLTGGPEIRWGFGPYSCQKNGLQNCSHK